MIEDKENGTAHWGSSGVFYRWSDGGVESTAFALRALLAVEPQSELIERAMTWLVRNRKGCRWEKHQGHRVHHRRPGRLYYKNRRG